MTNCEPDNAGLLAIYYASLKGNIVKDIIYGTPRNDIKIVWPDDPNLPSDQYLKQFPDDFIKSLSLKEPALQSEYRETFQEGADMQVKDEYAVLSTDIDQFWVSGD